MDSGISESENVPRVCKRGKGQVSLRHLHVARSVGLVVSFECFRVKSPPTMWFEARKQERKIRDVMINYQKRAERRREHYEKTVRKGKMGKKGNIDVFTLCATRLVLGSGEDN